MQYANSKSLLVSGLTYPLPPSSHEIPMGIFFPGWKLLVYIEYRLDTKKTLFLSSFYGLQANYRRTVMSRDLLTTRGSDQ